jgi:hypothetical protein
VHFAFSGGGGALFLAHPLGLPFVLPFVLPLALLSQAGANVPAT